MGQTFEEWRKSKPRKTLAESYVMTPIDYQKEAWNARQSEIAALTRERDEARVACAEIQSTLRTSLKIPKAWMRGHITFEQWDAACQKVFDAIDKPICTNALEARLREARLEEAEWWHNTWQGSEFSRHKCDPDNRICQRLAALKGAK